MSPEPHHRELALVEEVLSSRPVQLGGAGGRVRQEAGVEIERLKVLGAVDRDLPARGVEHHLLGPCLRDGREPFGLHPALHIGAIEVDFAIAVSVPRKELRDIGVLLPRRWRRERVAVLRLKVGLVLRIAETGRPDRRAGDREAGTGEPRRRRAPPHPGRPEGIEQDRADDLAGEKRHPEHGDPERLDREPLTEDEERAPEAAHYRPPRQASGAEVGDEAHRSPAGSTRDDRPRRRNEQPDAEHDEGRAVGAQSLRTLRHQEGLNGRPGSDRERQNPRSDVERGNQGPTRSACQAARHEGCRRSKSVISATLSFDGDAGSNR